MNRPWPSLRLGERLKTRLFTKPHRLRGLAAALRLITPVPRPDRWVFIVGCYGSGTSVLTRLLGLHPDVSSLNEGVFKTDELKAPEELGWPRMWSQVENGLCIPAAGAAVAVRLKKDWSLFLNSRSPIFVEKSISNSCRIKWLHENFENSHFIFVVRNGYAVAEGIRRNVRDGLTHRWPAATPTYPIGLCAEQWVRNNSVIERDRVSIPRFHAVSYEQLCAQPAATLNGLFDFIGASSSGRDAVLRRAGRALRNMNEQSISRLSDADIEVVSGVAAECLRQYGYTVLKPYADSSWNGPR